MLKRFLLFAGDYQYPDGGWNDFRHSYDTLEEARTEGGRLSTPDKDTHRHSKDWWHIVDIETGEYFP